jgi:Putative Ig domain/CHAP domain
MKIKVRLAAAFLLVVGTSSTIQSRASAAPREQASTEASTIGADGLGSGGGISFGTRALPPARLLDTRPGSQTVDGSGAGQGRVAAQTTIELQVAGRGGVPTSGVAAVVLNVTAVDTSNAGFITVWPTGDQLPTASNINYGSGQTIANLVMAKVGTNGKVSIYTYGATHLIADVTGWVADQGPLHIVNGETAPSGHPGLEYSLQLNASGGRPDYHWSTDVLPAGLVLDAATGVLSGTPVAQGDTTVHIIVTDLDGKAAARTALLSVTPPTTDPQQSGLGSGGFQAHGTVLVRGGEWLGGNGVDVISNGGIGCFNGATTTTVNSCTTTEKLGSFTAFTYQCVELFERLIYSRGWGSLVGGNANQLFDNASDVDFEKHRAGSGYLPVPGDAIVWGGGWGGYGHVAIVEFQSAGHVGYVEQNSSNTGRSSTTIDAAGNLGSRGTLITTGYLHARRNTQQTSNPPSPVSPLRIGALLTDERFYAKEGSLDAGWVLEQGAVRQVVMSGLRIGVVLTDGNFYVKEGGLDAGWVLELTGVQQAAMAGNRIGAVLTDGKFFVKEGAIDAGWVLEQGAVKQPLLTATRIGAVLTDGSFYVKEGGLDAGWVLELTGVQQAAMAGNRIGATVGADLRYYVKEGAIDAGWVLEQGAVKQPVLSG